MPTVFISYRRKDAGGYVPALHQRLSATLKRQEIFIDVDSIQPGNDFRNILRDALSKSDVILAVVGPHWLTEANETGLPRILEDGDTVRDEIASAFSLKRRVLPVLVGGATMPKASQLPTEIQQLASIQAVEISVRHVKRDLDELVRQVYIISSSKPPAEWSSLLKAAVLIGAMGVTIAIVFFRIAPTEVDPTSNSIQPPLSITVASSAPQAVAPQKPPDSASSNLSGKVPEPFTPSRTDRAIKALDGLNRPVTMSIFVATPAVDKLDMDGSGDFEIQKRALEEMAKHGRVISPELRKQGQEMLKRAKERAQRSQDKVEFLERIKKPTETLTEARRSLVEYSNTNSKENWSTAWLKLRDAQIELNGLIRSAPWRREVPENYTQAVSTSLRNLKSEALLPDE